MLLTVRGLSDRLMGDRNGLFEELADRTYQKGDVHREAWANSLPVLSSMLMQAHLEHLHVHIQTGQAHSVSTHLSSDHHLLLEYNLPASSSWCDVILLGQNHGVPAAVIVELKHWAEETVMPGRRPGLISVSGQERSHPSDQVQGYVEYCRKFHSAVQKTGASVHGCVLFTKHIEFEDYLTFPHEELVRDFPMFSSDPAGGYKEFVGYLSSHLHAPDPDFATLFESGGYRQDRSFVRQVARLVKSSTEKPFVLLDEQRRGFEVCMAEVTDALSATAASGGKRVIIVQGPPGSGKSVLASNIWAELGQSESVSGDVVFCTTSGSQKTNWKGFFQSVAKDRSARWLVKSANAYNPGLNQVWLKQQRRRGHPVAVADWRKNMHLYSATVKPEKVRVKDDSVAVSVVDEAHALIDPSVPGKEGVSPSGWMMHAGPQGWHVMRASKISIFLLDDQQSYRDNETTTIANLRAWVREWTGRAPVEISLEGAQFRCGGSREYVDWLEALLAPKARAFPAGWVGTGRPAFKIYDSPQALEDALRVQHASGQSVRLLASYSRPWKTKGDEAPHDWEPSRQDFHFTQPHVWSRVWNYAPLQDYTLFIQAPSDSRMGSDPLCEVGCPYVVRGFDFDHVGLLWLSDLVWRKDRWVVNLEHVHESALRNVLSRARKEKRGASGPAGAEVLVKILRAYRILLTRAVMGFGVWFEDAETREHVEGALKAR